MHFKLYATFISPHNISKALFLLQLLKVMFNPALYFVWFQYQLTVSTVLECPPKRSVTMPYCEYGYALALYVHRKYAINTIQHIQNVHMHTNAGYVHVRISQVHCYRKSIEPKCITIIKTKFYPNIAYSQQQYNYNWPPVRFSIDFTSY